MNPVEGVRYTVPGTINVDRMDENLTVRFRVGGVYKNCYISAYFDDERVIHRKRPVVALPSGPHGGSGHSCGNRNGWITCGCNL